MTAVSLGGVDRAELPDYVNPADLWDGRRQVKGLRTVRGSWRKAGLTHQIYFAFFAFLHS